MTRTDNFRNNAQRMKSFHPTGKKSPDSVFLKAGWNKSSLRVGFFVDKISTAGKRYLVLDDGVTFADKALQIVSKDRPDCFLFNMQGR